MPVRSTSKDALEIIRPNLPASMQPIYDCLDDLGPCHDNRILEYLQQKQKQKPSKDRKRWRITGVNARRNDLINRGEVLCLGKFEGKWEGQSKKYLFHGLKIDSRPVPPGWVEIPDDDTEPLKITQPLPAPVARSTPVISPSVAGATLAAARHRKKYRPGDADQGTLF